MAQGLSQADALQLERRYIRSTKNVLNVRGTENHRRSTSRSNHSSLVLLQVQVAPQTADAIKQIIQRRRSVGSLVKQTDLLREWIDEGIAREKKEPT